jgi:hypothetical protein
MKMRRRRANVLAAAAIASLGLLPLYGDPRPSPVTHPDWARMMLRGLDLLDSTPLSAQASQVFATLSWKNSLAFRADRYVTGEGVRVVEAGEVRRVLASAETGEVAYPIAVARGGDYRVRLLLSGDPALPVEAEIRALGQDKPEKVLSVPGNATPAWADAGTVHLDPGAYSATVLLPKGASLEYVELAPPCLNPIEPIGGWKPAAVATTGDVAVTVLKALDLEHELPPSDTAISVEAEDIKAEGPLALEASYGPMPGLAGLWLKAGPKGTDASVFLDLPEAGLYAVSVFGAAGGGMRFTADACRKSVICPEPATSMGPRWRQVFSGEFAGGRHFVTLSLAQGAAVQRIRVERKKDAVTDYIGTVRRLGLDLGAPAPISREKAVAAMRFLKARRGLDPLNLCQDILERERTLVAVVGGAGQPVTPPGPGGPGGPGPGPGPGPNPPPPPPPPLGPPVLPPVDPASPTVPNP